MKNGKLKYKDFILVSLCLYSSTGLSIERINIKLGLMFRFSESYDNTVGDMLKGIQTALKIAKKDHPEIHITLIKYNHDRSFESVLNSVNKAIKEKVDIVIGGEDSGRAMIMSEYLGKEKIPFITPTATNPKVTSLSDLTFAISMSDDRVAKLLSDFYIKILGAKKIGVVRGISRPYTKFLSTKFANSSTKLLMKNSKKNNVKIFDFVKGTYTFTKIISEWKKDQIKHIAMLSYESTFIQFWSQCAAINYFPIFLGADGWGDANALQKKLFSGETTNESIIYQSAYWKEDASHTTAKTFRKIFMAMHHKSPNAWSAVSFDAVHILVSALNAIRKSNIKVNGDAIKQALIDLPNIEVATSETFKFGKNRSPIKQLAIYRIDNKGVFFEKMVK